MDVVNSLSPVNEKERKKEINKKGSFFNQCKLSTTKSNQLKYISELKITWEKKPSKLGEITSIKCNQQILRFVLIYLIVLYIYKQCISGWVNSVGEWMSVVCKWGYKARKDLSN